MKPQSNLIYEFAPYSLDLGQGKLFRSGKEIKLRPKVFDLLAVLVQHYGQVIEKDELMRMLWPDPNVLESALTVTIGELRQKLGGSDLIQTVDRRGYRFAAPVKIVNYESSPEDEPPPPGGALPVNSRFYIARQTDDEFYRAIGRCDSIVLVKGARQVGKTSLLARGLQRARESGAVVVLTDLQHLSNDVLTSLEKLLLALGERLAEQLDLKTTPHDGWRALRSANTNFEYYLRHEVLEKISAPLVWGLDEIDRLFGFDYAGEIFGLFRSWHNLRALEPAGPWRRMTLAMAYATEAHLFVADLNQSPFNVGVKLTLEDFTLDQIAELNDRYGAPLKNKAEVERFFSLLGGHPYLAQRGLYEMVHRKIDLSAIEAKGDHDEGIVGDHLRRMMVSLERNRELYEAVRSVLQGKPRLTLTDFYHLRSAGVLAGDSASDAKPRCRLYANFLTKRLC